MKPCLTLRQCLALKRTKVVGIAADHGGHELKEYLGMMLREAGAEVVDFGDRDLVPEDDYPDFVVPLARAVAAGQVERGVAICGSGVGACVVANKVPGIRACLIHDPFSAHQGVEDDDLNLICLGGLVVGRALAWDLVRTFLTARFSGEARHRRRLAKVAALENVSAPEVLPDGDSTGGASVGPTGTLRLYLIRHGETAWSRSGQYTGHTDIPLTPHGEAAAAAVGKRLGNLAFDHVLTSPLQRARQTCILADLGPVPEIEPDLAEWDHGDDEGRTPGEILASRPDWNLFADGSPNGESPAQISERADRFITRVRSLDGNVAIFSHSHICRVLAARWIGLAVVHAEPFLLSTAAVSILGYGHDSADRPAIELWNSVDPATSDQIPRHSSGLTPERAIQRWENEGGEIPASALRP